MKHQPSSVRVVELDGLRGVAVGLVLVWHFAGTMIDRSLDTWAELLYAVTIFGRTGVDLFFVLSGFLITGILLDRQRLPPAFLRSFYIRRLLRIVPSYALLATVFWAVVSLGVDNDVFNADTPLWHHATFTQNLWMAAQDRWGASAIPVTWSVAIEEQFYLFFPLLVLSTPYRQLPALLLIIAVGSACFRGVAWLGYGSAFTMYVHTLSRLDGLAAGGCVAWLWRHPDFHLWMSRWRSHMRRVSKLLVWVGIPVFLVAIRINLPLNVAVWGHTYLTLLYSLALLIILDELPAGGVQFLRNLRLTRLGAISYTVYLFHPFFLASIFMIAGRSERYSLPQDFVLAAAALCGTLLWATVSHRYFERPLTRASRLLQY